MITVPYTRRKNAYGRKESHVRKEYHGRNDTRGLVMPWCVHRRVEPQATPAPTGPSFVYRRLKFPGTPARAEPWHMHRLLNNTGTDSVSPQGDSECALRRLVIRGIFLTVLATIFIDSSAGWTDIHTSDFEAP